MESANTLILVGAALIAASVIISAFASRFGTPLLLVFLILGMLAGEDGPGGIQFHDVQLTYLIGSIALGIILFDGGMRTHAGSVRVGIGPGIVLATLGVFATAAVIAFFAVELFDFTWLQGLLLGSVVGSTDAAAIFSVLSSRGLAIKRRVSATLEIESGCNDPMAVFLTIVLVQAIAAGKTGLDLSVVTRLVSELAVGGAAGLVGGYLMVAIINRLELAQALYPLLASALALAIFGATASLHGSGFLAIYVAGLVMGNRQVHSAQNILRVHDGLAWLAQIGMFLVLGLLATPRELVYVAPTALLVAVVLTLVARPIAVVVCLAPFRFPWREQAFIAWMGLRGAVPIILGVFPLVAGIENAWLYFNIAFFVVLVSLFVQGWTVAPAARVLQLEVPPASLPAGRYDLGTAGHWDLELVRYDLAEDSPAIGTPLAHLPLPEQTSIAGVLRDERIEPPEHVTALNPGDRVFVLAEAEHVDALNRAFIAPHHPERLEEHKFFGDLVLDADAGLEDIAAFYGVEMPPGAGDVTLGAYLQRVFRKRPVVGDRLKVGRVEFVIRETAEDGRVSRVGLKFR
ncbi:MAG TPA: potassium/proton antiporter [Burkholderiales bacterium]|nr:potassium/proton antiporter [Burkholderiales bacterium]